MGGARWRRSGGSLVVRAATAGLAPPLRRSAGVPRGEVWTAALGRAVRESRTESDARRTVLIKSLLRRWLQALPTDSFRDNLKMDHKWFSVHLSSVDF